MRHAEASQKSNKNGILLLKFPTPHKYRKSFIYHEFENSYTDEENYEELSSQATRTIRKPYAIELGNDLSFHLKFL